MPRPLLLGVRRRRGDCSLVKLVAGYGLGISEAGCACLGGRAAFGVGCWSGVEVRVLALTHATCLPVVDRGCIAGCFVRAAVEGGLVGDRRVDEYALPHGLLALVRRKPFEFVSSHVLSSVEFLFGLEGKLPLWRCPGLVACWPVGLLACGLRLSPWAGASGCRLLNRPSVSSPRPRALLTRNRFDPYLMPFRYLWGDKRPWYRSLSRWCCCLGRFPFVPGAGSGICPWWVLPCEVDPSRSLAMPLRSLRVCRLRAMRTCTRAYRRVLKCTVIQQVCALQRPFWTVRPVQTKRHVEHYGWINSKSKPTLGVFTKLLQL